MHPSASSTCDPPWLTVDRAEEVASFLAARGWLGEGETIRSIAPAGEGNMNLTLRVVSDRRSVILKQSRPWVEKYPQVAAPEDRIVFERRFYARTASIDAVARLMPRVLGEDESARALLLEDLGEASDFTTLYAGGAIRDDEIEALAGWSAALHVATRGEAEPAFANRAMRRLNHQHIFVLPLSDSLPVPLEDLQPGLAPAAAALRDSAVFRTAVENLGRRYLADGPCLLHGDYYPGSWLRTPGSAGGAGGPRVIDPEFCFYGEAAFEAALPVAHFALAGQPWATAQRWLAAYRQAGGPALDGEQLAGFAGVEVMRRVIGLAQLPLPRGDGRRIDLLERAQATVIGRNLEDLW